jgi:uncharacterized protein (TIGR02145 family)
VISTGVTGLTATLSSGYFSIGSGNLVYSITGTPTSAGTATFAINTGGQTCDLDISVSSTPVCRAKIDATTYRNFMCHNLGAANTNADPFTPSWEINGGYWQWGRLSQAAAGPVGPYAGETNEAAVAGWNAANAPNSSWSDASKTVNDPCPAGYRIPTKAQWDAVITNNTLTNLGSWPISSTNYSSGKKIGTELMLPAVGYRYSGNGALYGRGDSGHYCSSTENGASNGWHLYFHNGGAETYGNDLRSFGFSVRCIAEIPGVIGSLDCNGATISGSLASGYVASCVSASIAYTGGDGESYSGQTVISTGVTGLTATLSSGNFTIGSGNLVYSITGTPTSAGTATFAINIGGQTCDLNIPVSSTPVCRAKIDATTYKNFMCHNLGAANTNADPFTPSWEINGGYWQWGRLSQAAAGPTGPGVSETNEAAVSGWNTSYAPNDSWADTYKTANDPCPAGYRVPTKLQWEGVVANNAPTDLGSWTLSSINYSCGKKFGTELMLPVAGIRGYTNGTLTGRSWNADYWSSSPNSSNYAWQLSFTNSNSNVSVVSIIRTFGFSVRCIAE